MIPMLLADVETLRQQLDAMLARSPLDFVGKRKCIKGYNCGGACITNTKQCRKEMSGQAVNITQRLEAALRARGVDPNNLPPAPTAKPKEAPKPPEPAKAAVRVSKLQVGPETRRKDGRKQIEVTAEVSGIGNDGQVKMRVEEVRAGTGSWRVVAPYRADDGVPTATILKSGMTRTEAIKQAQRLFERIESRADNGKLKLKGSQK